MSNKILTAVCALAAAGAALAEDAAFMKLPPPVYAGLVKNYMQKPYENAPSVQIFARRADGKLLASAKTSGVRENVNYYLRLPMLSAASEGIVGLLYKETAYISFLDGDVMWKNFVTVTPEQPGFQRLDVTLGHDANGDGIADEYAAYMQQMMSDYKIAGTYDPEADYNKDGVSNRAHYLAGTNPFAGLAVGGEVIADTPCTIASLMNVRSFVGEEYFALTFNALADRPYEILTISDLAAGWGEATVAASSKDVDGETQTDAHWFDVPGEVTLYVPKGKAQQGFYKLAIGQ